MRYEFLVLFQLFRLVLFHLFCEFDSAVSKRVDELVPDIGCNTCVPDQCCFKASVQNFQSTSYCKSD